MAKMTPSLYATGQWQVAAPFTVDPDLVLTCQAIRSLAAIQAAGQDPFTAFYQPQGLSKAQYQTDQDNLANIITLMSDEGLAFYVPDTYIQSYPDTRRIPYRQLVLALDLGALPDTLALDDYEQKIKDLALDSLGLSIRTQVYQAKTTDQSLTVEDHRVAENNRLAKIENNHTLTRQVRQLEQKNEELKQQVEALTQLARQNDLLA